MIRHLRDFDSGLCTDRLHHFWIDRASIAAQSWKDLSSQPFAFDELLNRLWPLDSTLAPPANETIEIRPYHDETFPTDSYMTHR